MNNQRDIFIKASLMVATIVSLCLNNTMYAQEYTTIEYSDNFTSEGSPSKVISLLPKAQRVSKTASTIYAKGSESLDEHIIKCADFAISTWESNIVNGVGMIIEFKVEDMEDDIKTKVRYKRNGDVYIPVALDAYVNNMVIRETSNPDGIITISSRTNWDYSVGENITSTGKSLTFGIMRAIARIMGFGSNVVIDDNGEYKFDDKRYHTKFNTFVVNSSGVNLSSISVSDPNPDLKNFIEKYGDTFWIDLGSDKYQLAPPPYSGKCPPFVFLADANSLMKSSPLAGDCILQVDENTHNVLTHLGWTLPVLSRLAIISDDVPDTGLASAYISHRFRVDQRTQKITKPKWTLKMPLRNGNISTIDLKDEGMACTVEPIENEEKYKINSDGDIEAQLLFSYSLNGVPARPLSFKIYFELKPLIEYAEIEKIVDNSPYTSYDAYYKVKYRGAEKIEVTVEEEFSPNLRSKYINEPAIAYGIADHIKSRYNAWISFCAKNQYGEAYYTIALQPFGVVEETTSYSYLKTTDNSVTSLNLTETNGDNDIFEVYDVTGFKLGSYANVEDIDAISRKGILIVKHMHDNKIIDTTKIIKR